MAVWPVTIPREGVPENEWEAISHLESALNDLAGYVNEFRDALILFDYCLNALSLAQATGGDRGSFGAWQFVAAREGAMSIYHFGKAVENISASLRDCPTIRGRVDHVSRRTTLKKLKALFPEFEDMRHSVAHAGELMEDADTAERHSIQGPLSHGQIEIGPGKVMLRNCFAGSTGREFMNTFEGKIQTYEISSATYTALRNIMNEFYSAF